MNPAVLIVGVVLVGYAYWLRQSTKAWTFRSGLWQQRFVFHPRGGMVSFTGKDGQTKFARVSWLMSLDSNPVRLVVNASETRAYVVGTDAAYAGLGLFLIVIQIASAVS